MYNVQHMSCLTVQAHVAPAVPQMYTLILPIIELPPDQCTAIILGKTWICTDCQSWVMLILPMCPFINFSISVGSDRLIYRINRLTCFKNQTLGSRCGRLSVAPEYFGPQTEPFNVESCQQNLAIYALTCDSY